MCREIGRVGDDKGKHETPILPLLAGALPLALGRGGTSERAIGSHCRIAEEQGEDWATRACADSDTETADEEISVTMHELARTHCFAMMVPHTVSVATSAKTFLSEALSPCVRALAIL